MNWFQAGCAGRPVHPRCAALVIVLSIGGLAAGARAADVESPAGRIDFEAAKLPPATVEVDLSEGLIGDLFGLGEAAITGATESLRKSTGSGSEATQLAAEQLAAAQQLMELVRGVVHEARVRVYEDLSDDAVDPTRLMTQFDEQLQAGQWENIVRVREGDQNVRVSLLCDKGAVRGVFVIAADGHDLVLANIVGDVSPENVKKLTAAAAQIGLENGLQQVLEEKMREMKHHRQPAATRPVSPQPPAPPTPQQP